MTIIRALPAVLLVTALGAGCGDDKGRVDAAPPPPDTAVADAAVVDAPIDAVVVDAAIDGEPAG